jgi:hypothetical protein
MKKSTILVLLFTAFLLAGCKKYRDTYVFTGRAFDQYTLVPIANADVAIFESYDRGHEQGVRLGNAVTDQNGNFAFETDDVRKEFRTFKIEVISTDAYAVGHTGISNLQPTYAVDIPCATHSQITYTFINANPFDQNDVLSNVYIDRPFGNQWVLPSAEILQGTSVNRSVWTSFCGYGINVLHYSVNKNAITQHYTDTIYTPNVFQWINIQDTINY